MNQNKIEANKEQRPTDVASGAVLGCCPSCNFDDAAYKEHQKAAPYYAGKREQYMPHLYKDRFLNEWVVECQNCGFDALFHCDTEKETADAWNALPRKQPNIRSMSHARPTNI